MPIHSDTLQSGDLTSFMYQVARGMEYLSSRGVRFEFRSIKAASAMLL